MNISHSRFILSKLKIFGEIITTYKKTVCPDLYYHIIFPKTLNNNYKTLYFLLSVFFAFE